MKKSIIYSFVGGVIFTIIMLLAFYIVENKKNIINSLTKQPKNNIDNSKISLCEVEDTRHLINDNMQNGIDYISEHLSDYYHKYPNLKVGLSILHDSVITLESKDKYASCQASLIITTDYNKEQPLKLDFYRYTVRVSDNEKMISIHNENSHQELEIIFEKIKKWIIYIDKN